MHSLVLRPGRRALERLLTLPAVRAWLSRRALSAWEAQGSVAFVCLGNICRSPFAALLARQREPRRSLLSAGTLPLEGRRSPGDAVAAAERWQVDLRGHSSHVLSPEMAARADAIFVFDLLNLLKVLRAHPRALGRVHLLGALAPDGPLFIRDPFGNGMAAFEEVYGQIAAALPGAEKDAMAGRQRRFAARARHGRGVTA